MGYRKPFSLPGVIDSTRPFNVTGLFSLPGVVSSVVPTTVWSTVKDGRYVPMEITMVGSGEEV